MRRIVFLCAIIIVLLLQSFHGTDHTIPDPGRGSTRIIVISDLNSSYGSTEYEPEVSLTLHAITEHWQPDIVLCAGDMIAGQDPALPDETVENMWKAFERTVLQPLQEAAIPFAFTLGNHDASAHPGHERDRALAEKFWTAPDRWIGFEFDDRSNFPYFYSFNHNNILIISLFASSAGVVYDTTQVTWLTDKLNSEQALDADLRIVFGHLPLYAIAEGRNHEGEVLDKADSLLSLFERKNIDIYISGHHHAYYPGAREGVDLLYSGLLGQGPRQLINTDLEPYQNVVSIDIDDEFNIHYTAYRVDTDAEQVFRYIDSAKLPEKIEGFNGYVKRLE